MKSSELTGRAREVYEAARAQGYDEAAALKKAEEVRSHVLLTEVFVATGMTPEAAEMAARGRHGSPAGPPVDEQLAALYEAGGLSPQAAQLAARGRP